MTYTNVEYEYQVYFLNSKDPYYFDDEDAARSWAQDLADSYADVRVHVFKKVTSAIKNRKKINKADTLSEFRKKAFTYSEKTYL